MTVLFVDDEPQVLQDLARRLITEQVAWDCDFASSGEDAIALLERARFDVIVTDLRMPGMDGASLLNFVSESYPDTVRIVLSQASDRDAVLRAIDAMHQFVSKPCDVAILKTTIDRAVRCEDSWSRIHCINLSVGFPVCQAYRHSIAS